MSRVESRELLATQVFAEFRSQVGSLFCIGDTAIGGFERLHAVILYERKIIVSAAELLLLNSQTVPNCVTYTKQIIPYDG